MFTGLVETIGIVRSVTPRDDIRSLEIEAPWAEELGPGASVAVDGVCLTAVSKQGDAFRVEAVAETLARTILGGYEAGRRVHLERALKVGDRLGGHFVQGHIDVRGIVRSIDRRGENRYIDIDLPVSGRAFVAPQGSIAINGVSLTVLAVDDGGFRVSIVPHTWRATCFGELQPGREVNVEYDLIARYLRRFSEVCP